MEEKITPDKMFFAVKQVCCAMFFFFFPAILQKICFLCCLLISDFGGKNQSLGNLSVIVFIC